LEKPPIALTTVAACPPVAFENDKGELTQVTAPAKPQAQ